jgi:hypothetical protein
MRRAMKRAALLLGMAMACAMALGQPLPPSNVRVVPTITIQPQSQTVMAGQSAAFSVAATGEAPLSYQWTFNGANVGSSISSYTRSNCQLADNGARVRVTVSDARGSVPSDTATLTVNPIGTIYYASPSGNSSNSGLSTNLPWPLQYAIDHAGVSNTIVLMDGTYSSAAGYGISGTIDCRTLKAINKWKAV